MPKITIELLTISYGQFHINNYGNGPYFLEKLQMPKSCLKWFLPEPFNPILTSKAKRSENWVKFIIQSMQTNKINKKMVIYKIDDAADLEYFRGVRLG